ncbi:hypothetical protein LTR53_006545 [Teratosphaeriaceae sp. CCFEE 6253]|nr:hypothetical protein LTR53_006545 [Teratosphaeriaceae sp. CCFEE 6253]
MTPPPASTLKASATVPLLYRVLLLYLEPLFALGGVALILLRPEQYLTTMTRGAVASLGAPQADFIHTQLAGGWLHFAWTEAIMLRLVDDLRVWKLLCMGMLLSDAFYTHSMAQGLGGWGEWVQVAKWTAEDWAVTITTLPFFLVRLCIVLGIGLKSTPKRA